MRSEEELRRRIEQHRKTLAAARNGQYAVQHDDQTIEVITPQTAPRLQFTIAELEWALESGEPIQIA
jgi:hypothetical protein